MKEEKMEKKEKQVDKTEARLGYLERVVAKMKSELEEKLGYDLDGDGKVGSALTKVLVGVCAIFIVAGLAFAEYIVDYDAGTSRTGDCNIQHDGTDYTLTIDKVAADSMAVSGAITAGRIDSTTPSTATMWYGAPLANEPSYGYTYFDEFFVAGYTANAADTNLAGLTVTQAGKFSEVADQGQWLVSVTDGDSDEGETIVVADDAAGGVLTITCNDKADDAVQIQMNGESFKLDKDLWYETKVTIEDVSEDTFFSGLTVADTDILGSLGNDFIGFYVDQSTNLTFQMAKNGAIVTNATLAVIADATAVTLGFFVDASASNAYVYVNDALAATHTASGSLPNDEALSPAHCILTTDTGSDYLKVDYTKIINLR